MAFLLLKRQSLSTIRRSCAAYSRVNSGDGSCFLMICHNRSLRRSRNSGHLSTTSNDYDDAHAWCWYLCFRHIAMTSEELGWPM